MLSHQPEFLYRRIHLEVVKVVQVLSRYVRNLLTLGTNLGLNFINITSPCLHFELQPLDVLL